MERWVLGVRWRGVPQGLAMATGGFPRQSVVGFHLLGADSAQSGPGEELKFVDTDGLEEA